LDAFGLIFTITKPYFCHVSAVHMRGFAMGCISARLSVCQMLVSLKTNTQQCSLHRSEAHSSSFVRPNLVA